MRRNAVAPGYTHSAMTDPAAEAAPEMMREIISRHSAMNRFGEGHEIAAAIAWLCCDASSFVNGAVLTIDGGDTTRLY